MKRLLYILTAVMMFYMGSSTFQIDVDKLSGKKDKVEVEAQFQRYYDTLSAIYKRNKIKFDYNKVSKVMHIDSMPPMYFIKDGKVFKDTTKYEGLYNKINKIIYINPSQMDAFWAGKYHEMVTIILAHEMAHSQGKLHSSDYCSLMYFDSTYSISLLRESTVEELVTAIYLTDYPLLEE